MSIPNVDWDTLRRALRGTVVLPGESGYDAARRLRDVQFDAVRPRVVVYCASTADVRTAMRFAQDQGLHLAVRSGGHSTAGYSTTDGMVLDVSRLDAVSVGERHVTLGPGAQAAHAAAALAPHGLATPAGFVPTISAGGFFSGGGIGLLTRSCGIGSDRVRSAKVVLADGRVVRCSQEEEPDLFWALRGGGGGNFGVVTAFEIAPVRVSRLVNFSLAWSWDRAPEVLAAWQRWAPAAPAELTSWLGLFLPDAAPGRVADLVVFGTWGGQPRELDRCLAELTVLVSEPPSASAAAELPYEAAMARWWYHPAGADLSPRLGASAPAGAVDRWLRAESARGSRIPYLTVRGRMFDAPMPSAGIEEFLAAFDADRRAGQARMSLSAALGGAADEMGRSDTAYVHRAARFHVDYTVRLTDPSPSAEERAAAAGWAGLGFATIDPYSSGESYQNYVDPALRNWSHAYYAENYDRLRRVKQHYDPDGVFRFGQSIGCQSPTVR